MPNSRLLLVVVLVCVVSSAAIGTAGSGATDAPQAQPGVLLDTIRANRKALVAVNLELSAEEADRFWPLYDRYQSEINAIGDRVATIIDDYIASFHDLSNERSLQLMRDYLTAEAERVQVRRAYLGQFAKIVPGRTVARFYQIENKMDAVLRYDLAAEIPVVDQNRGTRAK